MAGIRTFQDPRGDVGLRRYAPIAATQTYDLCDPVYLVTNNLTESIKDGTEILVAEFIGFAGEPAEGSLAASRAAAGMNFTGRDGAGAVTETQRTYIAPYQGQLFHTINFFTDATGATQDVVGGGDLGDLWQVCSAAAGNWGLCDVAGTPATDVCARVVNILDVNGMPFTGATADATAGTMATQIIFEIANLHECTQIMGGP